MNRDAFEKWFDQEYPADANGVTRSKYQKEPVLVLMKHAWIASRAKALEEAASLFPQPYMEYFGSDIQEAIRAIAQGGMK